jgi:hypothetical protein
MKIYTEPYIIADKILIAFATKKLYMSKADCFNFLSPEVNDITKLNSSFKILCTDGYLQRSIIPFNYYLLTNKGMEFFKSGGYKHLQILL